MNYLKQYCSVFFIFCACYSFAQSVGVGTGNPNSSAILDLSSTNKGLLLPRVADTSNINAPAEGLLIYNRAGKAPNYFDGNRWNNINSSNYVPVEGSIKYTISGVTSIGGLAVDAGPLDAVDYNNSFKTPYQLGTGAVGQTRGMDSIIFEKEFDGNSIVFKRALLAGSSIPTIEILQYMPGATTPFYSIKLSSARIIDQSFFISEQTGRLTERYSIVLTTIGYRDWVNGKSFSFNVSTRSFGTY